MVYPIKENLLKVMSEKYLELGRMLCKSHDKSREKIGMSSRVVLLGHILQQHKSYRLV